MEYVYIFSNPELEGILKIGRTKEHPELRIKQLNRNTGTFGEFKVEWIKEVSCSITVEKILHYTFRNFHVKKEFFNIDIDFAIQVSEKVIEKIAEIDIYMEKISQTRSKVNEQSERIKNLR